MQSRYKIVLLTPVFIIFSHYLAVFTHEYAHSLMAWLLGFKTNPLNINYGGTSLRNLILLSHINENVNYKLIFYSNHRIYMSLIAFAGPGLGNGLLFALSIWLLNTTKVKHSPYLYYFLFWFNLMNLGNFYDYIPIRAFATYYGDIAHINQGLGISPWWIFIIIGYIVAFLIWQFFTKTLIKAFIILKFNTIFFRAGLMIICVIVLFGFSGGIIGVIESPQEHIQYYGQVSYFLTITSFIAIPGIIITLWPTRKWVLNQVKQLT